MAVPESIVGAYEQFIEEIIPAEKKRGYFDNLLGRNRGSDFERCQGSFVSNLTDAVEAFAASDPESGDVTDAVSYMFAQAHERKKTGAAYWMLLASHVLTLPLIELLPPAEAKRLREEFEAEYPKRERLPAQRTVISALKDREKA